jgi:hypothetical protein
MLHAVEHQGVADAPARAPRRRRWQPWAAAAGIVLVLAGGGAWWLLGSARVVWPGEGSFGIGVAAGGDRDVWTFGAMSLCLEGVDAAVVDAVEVESGRALVTDFAVRAPLPPDDEGISYGFGSEPVRLADSGFGAGRTIRGRCDDGQHAELAVELTRPAQGTARAEGLFVHWSAGLRSGTVRVPATFALCDAPDGAGAECTI